MKTQQEVVKIIMDAFKGVTLGGGIGLWEAQAIDDYADQVTILAARKNDEVNNWAIIPPDTLNRCESSLSFFDADGMRFHIPAFILLDICGKSNSGPVFALTNFSEYTRSMFASLTPVQKEAISAFLHWCLSQKNYEFDWPRIQAALADYWDKSNQSLTGST